MMKRKNKQHPKCLTQWVGKLAIRILPELFYRKPEIVFITHVTKRGNLSGQLFTDTYNLVCGYDQLVEYTPRLYEKLKTNFVYSEARAVFNHQASLLREGKP